MEDGEEGEGPHVRPEQDLRLVHTEGKILNESRPRATAYAGCRCDVVAHAKPRVSDQSEAWRKAGNAH